MLCLEVMSSMQMQHWSTGPEPLPVCCGSIATSDEERPFFTGLPPAELSLRAGGQGCKSKRRRHGVV